MRYDINLPLPVTVTSVDLWHALIDAFEPRALKLRPLAASPSNLSDGERVWAIEAHTDATPGSWWVAVEELVAKFSLPWVIAFAGGGALVIGAAPTGNFQTYDSTPC
jgi:hypothetical protein